ncbi:MAG: lactate utilization protein [Clostridia bacterium]|nr:lactate utilization protein [Clostridia bacterium]
MNEIVKMRNEKLLQESAKALEKRNMTSYIAADKDEALKLALDLIPKGASIGMGGCKSAEEIGLVDVIKGDDYHFIDRFQGDPREREKETFDADVFICSTNAMSKDGILVNIDGNSNRVSAMAYGPKKLIYIVGVNKIESDLDGAIKRARNVAAPINAGRFDVNTPCKEKGLCMNCTSPDTICCQVLITRYSRHAGRIHVILVNEELGF